MESETYNLSEFCTSEWCDRAEYSEKSPSFDHIAKCHDAEEFPPIFSGRCGRTDFWCFIHYTDPRYRGFVVYVYEVDGERAETPTGLVPAIGYHGNTHEGIIESFGCVHGAGGVNLRNFADALKWVDGEMQSRGWVLYG